MNEHFPTCCLYFPGFVNVLRQEFHHARNPDHCGIGAVQRPAVRESIHCLNIRLSSHFLLLLGSSLLFPPQMSSVLIIPNNRFTFTYYKLFFKLLRYFGQYKKCDCVKIISRKPLHMKTGIHPLFI